MDEISAIVDRINGVTSTLFYLEGRIKALQAERDAHENGKPTLESLESLDIKIEDAKRTQARAMARMGEAQAQLQQAKLEAKRAARNEPLKGRPFATLLG